jgi:hypothetical protein
MFHFYFGDVGSGKSLVQADLAVKLLKESVKIQKKYKLPLRQVWCNFHLNKYLSDKYKDRLFVWHDPKEMIFTDYPQCSNIRTGYDALWDEIAVEIPADKWKETDLEIRRFFAQHRKRGIRIFANTQDYLMCDINARRMATEVFSTSKVFGSRDPSPTLPPVKRIFGLIWVWRLDKQLIRADDQDRKRLDLLPRFLFFNKWLVSIYDTTEDIAKNENYLLKHQKKICPVCGFEKVVHI